MASINKHTKVPFNGTAEQAERLDKALEGFKKMPGGLMPALQKAQEIYGYLPIEVQTKVAEALNLSLEEVFGVSTFYSQFTLNPSGKYKIGVCLGTACYVKGAGDLVDKVKEVLKIEAGECTADGKFSLVETRCIGCCGLAPVITVNEDVYGKLTSNQIPGIIKKY
ncbi:MAG TPA: NAD(P)H-dependent oxidoreductase subunit E [Clostridiales bacterium]|nr:NAD(P)H-dependent oxidoreductase subunit E [Clostridiales bacterium]